MRLMAVENTSETTRAIPHRVHLVGIGGMHMSAIAQILLARGHAVSGSDLRPSAFTERLAGLGATVFAGHHAEHLGEAELVLTTSAAGPDNPELVEAHRRGLPVLKRAEMVARLMEGAYGIAVAGTHGKTTTTGLLAFVLERSGLAPTFLVGGELVDLGTNAAAGEGRHVVVEADEFDAAFLQYRPQLAVVTNIEADHLDFYGSIDRLAAAFAQFLSQVERRGHIVACADSVILRGLLERQAGSAGGLQTEDIQFYGLEQESTWTAVDVEPQEEGGYAFRVLRAGRPYGEFRTLLPGHHNVANALAVIVAARVLGLPLEYTQRAVAEYRGIRRRFERVGEAAGVTVMDDYAHHPTEVRATLASARERFPGRRLVGVFQPHTYSRSRYLLEGFRTCFEGLDVLFVTDTYAAREEPDAGIGGSDLAPAIRKPPARFVGDFAAAADAAVAELRPGDVLFTIGAGDVDQVATMVLERLRRKSGKRAKGTR
jgi:UDP-N-acetylmuramate--alanine ligase